jgi:osmoprotectant transport system ATP-binding protein
MMESGRLVQYDSPEIILSRPGSKFVRDFVGADRALKRLSRISIRDFIKTAAAVNVNRPKKEALASATGHRWLWVVDDDEQLIGWVDRNTLMQSVSIREAMDEGDASKIALSDSATLREALSRMLELGFKHIPVVDYSQRLIGEVALGDIEAATAEGEG